MIKFYNTKMMGLNAGSDDPVTEPDDPGTSQNI